ncbi:MAG: ROK family protein [Ruminococcaceae bacterium]|nr:ROK family protein [Oscillospiraceae bacterium]
MAEYYLGIDLGGTNIAVGLVDQSHNMLAKMSTPTLAERTSEAIIADIAAVSLRLLKEKGLDPRDVQAAGIAAPGIADGRTGMVMYSCNLPFRKTPICAMLAEQMGIPRVYLDNDANAAAWGEAVAGAAKGTADSVMITLGTGVGGGIIINHRIISGFNAAGGELGHIVIEQGGRPCACGRRGCWETYSSATGLVNLTREKIEECRRIGRKSLMIEMLAADGKVSGRTSFNAMREGDEAAREVVDTYIHYLACGLTNIINIFQPEVISLGGGVSNERENLLNPLLPIIQKEQYGGGVVPQTQLRIAQLGNDAGIIGAALLGMQG